jgi:sugar phosphate isomerase/epimerase
VRTLLNSIAVEPNRWAKDRPPAYDLGRDLLPRIREYGFRRVEVWQHHLSGRSLEDTAALREAGARLGVDFPVAGAYPDFLLEDQAWPAMRKQLFGLTDRASLLGSQWIKFFFGRRKGGELTPQQLELTTHRAREWIAYGRDKGLGFCAELHGWTLFDPYEFGRRYLAEHPELDIRVCFQPSGSEGTASALARISELGGLIVHAHFSGSNAAGRCLLKDAALDWPALVAALKEANREFLPSLEFVRSGFPAKGQPFDLEAALADAAADAEFLDRLL